MVMQFLSVYEKCYVVLKEEDGRAEVRIDFPVGVQMLGGRYLKLRYNSVHRISEKHFDACAVASFPDGFKLQLEDEWMQMPDGDVSLKRRVKCLESKSPRGIRLTTEFRIQDKMARSFDDYQIIFPGAFYNKNDTDLDGMDDYLGTFNQDYRDDRNPGLFETAWCPQSGNYYSLIRADVPVEDHSFSREQLEARHFVHRTDIGSLGFAPSQYKTSELLFRCDYPFYERNSYCLNVDTSEWSAYREMDAGDEFTVSYILRAGQAEDLTDAGWQNTVYQMGRILHDDIKLPFSLETAMACRRDLVHNSYREFPDREYCPAGYFVHFSPRHGYGKQNILEFGFAGQQQMLCYTMLCAAGEMHSEEYRRRAVTTLDFFIKKCVHDSGIPYGLYDIDRDDYIFWWTGVLFPFQYSHDRTELEKYLGSQVVSALMSVAEELKKVDGNYTRTMVEAMYYLWLCYEKERENGVIHEEWKNTVIHFCDTFAEIQNENGSWYRAYTMEGLPLKKPAEWFGSNELEQGSGVIFPIEVLAEVYDETGDIRYLEACRRAADFICSAYVPGICYVGGLNDTTHKKSVKIDAVGVMFAMRSLLMVYEMTKDGKYLKAAADAGKVLATWTFLWDIPFDENTLLGRHGFRTTGWAGCDVIPACSYVDDEFAEFVPDLLKIAGYCCDIHLAKLAKIVFLGMQHGLSTPEDMYEYEMAGVQCEGYMTSLWLSDTERPEFSGAVAKMKGDDNDTCNGLVNGQQLVTRQKLLSEYGTMDMEKILASVINKA